MKEILFSDCALENIDEIYNIELNSSNLWKKKYFSDELEIDFSKFTIAKIDNEIIGFIITWDLKGDIQINNIAIKNNYRNLKIGTKLLEYTINYYKELKPEKIFLEVKEKNLVAIEFYLNNGFIKVGIRKNYYNDDNALLMEMKLAIK